MYGDDILKETGSVEGEAAEETKSSVETEAETERTERPVESTRYFDYTYMKETPIETPPVKKKKEKSKKPAGFFKKAMTSVALGLLFGAVAGAGFFGVSKGLDKLFPDEQKQTTGTDIIKDVNSPTVDYSDIVSGGNGSPQYVTYVQNDITEMVDNVMPAMVSIVNNFTSTSYNFWGQGIKQNSMASGSGIIVGRTDTELLIATNNHVVESTNKLEVTFINDSKAEAIIKGTDPDMDLAVIAVAIDSLDADTKDAIAIAKLGDSDNLKLGEPVVAIGNALGYGQSVTTGIVSALNREIETDDYNVNTFIQTDAAINPGNSGGALLNINGEVIGINSSKIGGTTIEGMGYAIPISSASPILNELMTREIREKVDADRAGYLGIGMQAITEDVMNSLGLPKGIYVKEVTEGGPADKAGLLKRDIIVKFDGQRVSNNSELKELLSYYKAGESVVLTVQRAIDGEYEEIEITVELGKKPENFE